MHESERIAVCLAVASAALTAESCCANVCATSMAALTFATACGRSNSLVSAALSNWTNKRTKDVRSPSLALPSASR